MDLVEFDGFQKPFLFVGFFYKSTTSSDWFKLFIFFFKLYQSGSNGSKWFNMFKLDRFDYK